MTADRQTEAVKMQQLGLQHHSSGHFEAAESAFRAALQADPAYLDAWNSLGSLLMIRGKSPEGAECFKNALSVNPDHFNSLLNYGRYLSLTRKPREAEKYLRRAVKSHPDQIKAHRELGLLLYKSGMHDQAVACFKQCVRLNSGDLRAHIAIALSMPQVYSGEEDLNHHRQKYKDGLETLEANTNMFLALNRVEKIDAIQTSNALLAYQGRNDLELQRKFADFQRTVLESELPHLYENIVAHPTEGRRLRVGFVSEFFYSSTVGKYFRSWITELDRSRFETHVFSLANKSDGLSSEIQNGCDVFHQQNFSFVSLANAVHEARLDVLIYPELGLNPRTFALASLRLAPVQCAAWGHPVTTGHQNIDFYFTVQDMEPKGAENHYQEKLLMLPGIGTSYIAPTLPQPIERSALGLPENKILYLIPQSLFKLHPHNDAILLDILEREPRSVIVMFKSTENAINRQFSERLGKSFAERNLPFEGRLKVLPRLGHQDYLRVNMVCDVMLDSLYWSGGNTALDAIACGLPIVTLAGDFMRGRQSYAMLKSMGLDELIAKDTNDYVRIALELATDQTLLGHVRNKLNDRKAQIFEQKEPVRALESDLISISANPRDVV
jgi:predicted O-linked N-acetylglucosamine transferase (SPINDLY family)